MTTYTSYFSQPPARCMSCLRSGGVHALDCLDNQPAEMVVQTTNPRPVIPVWAVACVFWGLVLMAIGGVLRDPVARLVWGAIHG